MISKGWQIRAARGILRWTGPELADHAGLHTKTVEYWERHDSIRPNQNYGGGALDKMRHALEGRGIEFVNAPAPGVLQHSDAPPQS